MGKIKLTKRPSFNERLINANGQNTSNLNLEGSFALNLHRNESYIKYNTADDAWYLDIDSVVDFTPINNQITVINNNIGNINTQISNINTNITNLQNTFDEPWVFYPVPYLIIKGYDANDNYLYDIDYDVIGPDTNINYFTNKNVYFKYKVLGSTVFMQYRLALLIPDTSESPLNLFKIKIDLLAINAPIFSAQNEFVDRYYLGSNLPAVQRSADHLQMCYYESGKLVFTCNNFINGHHADKAGFNFDFGAANNYMYTQFKLILAATHIFEKSAIVGSGSGGSGGSGEGGGGGPGGGFGIGEIGSEGTGGVGGGTGGSV